MNSPQGILALFPICVAVQSMCLGNPLHKHGLLILLGEQSPGISTACKGIFGKAIAQLFRSFVGIHLGSRLFGGDVCHNNGG